MGRFGYVLTSGQGLKDKAGLQDAAAMLLLKNCASSNVRTGLLSAFWTLSVFSLRNRSGFCPGFLTGAG